MINIPHNTLDRKSLISIEARKISEQNPDQSSLENWLNAEKIIDSQIFTSSLPLKDIYKSLMIKFFSSIDLQLFNACELAKEYFSFIDKNDETFNILNSSKRNDNGIRNVSLLTQDISITQLTKKSLLLAETSLFGHNPETVNPICYKTTCQGTGEYGSPYATDTEYFVHCKEINEIGSWLQGCNKLLQLGELFYYPKMVKKEHFGDGTYYRVNSEISENHLFDAIVDSKRIVENFTSSPLRNKFIKTIVEIEIPFIEHIDMEQFSKLCYDENDRLTLFRDFIYENMLEYSNADGSESFTSDLARISLKMKTGVRSLTSDFKSLKTKTAFQASGAIIGTLSATLVSINSEIFNDIANIVGISGGLGLSLTAIQNHILNKRLKKDSPFYFLWLIQSNK